MISVTMLWSSKSTYTAQVTDANLNGHAYASLVASRYIVGQPRNTAWESRVHGASCDEDASIHNAWVGGSNTPSITG